MVITMYEANIYEQVARNIKKYRKIAGLTQAELAEAIGVSHEFIRRIESKKGKKTFSFQTIWNISRVLHVSLDKLTEVDVDEFLNLWWFLLLIFTFIVERFSFLDNIFKRSLKL